MKEYLAATQEPQKPAILSFTPPLTTMFSPISVRPSSEESSQCPGLRDIALPVQRTLYYLLAITWLTGPVASFLSFIVALASGVSCTEGTFLGPASLGNLASMLDPSRNIWNGWDGYVLVVGMLGYEVLRNVGDWQVGTWMVC